MKDIIWNRRSFIKTTVLGALIFFSNPSFAADAFKENADTPPGRLLLVNTHNNETLDVTYRKESGEYDQDALDSINHILRCPHNEEEVKMDIRMIEFLNAVDKELGDGGNEIHVISGYRSPEYNALLRKRSKRVAKHSVHTWGKAVDFRIPGIPASKIKRTAINMELGGVGYYPRKGFVHIDSGSFRYW